VDIAVAERAWQEALATTPMTHRLTTRREPTKIRGFIFAFRD
jgi:hypothetical protein